MPSIVTCGFLGLEPGADALRIHPKLPGACPEMGVANLLYRRVPVDILATSTTLSIALKDTPQDALRAELPPGWRSDDGATGPRFRLANPGVYRFVK